MVITVLFVLNSGLLGIGLAMDAFSVSLANGLNEPAMKKSRMAMIAGVFAFFQFAMPMIGWLCIHTIAKTFEAFQQFIPWIALALLGFIGGKMLLEGIRGGSTEETITRVTFGGLMLQGIATSIDALSVGFTIANYDVLSALICGLIIGFATFIICTFGLTVGKKAGTRLAGKASILGGVILIGIGLEIFIKSFI